MRIIAGLYRGHPLQAPPGRGTRPTTDRTRAAIFSLVESRLDLGGARVLDLFAGTGALGLEALSRGAAHATFVEQHAAAFAALRANAHRLGADARCTLLRTDALRLTLADPFDLILADPPYDLPALPTLPDRLLPRLAPEGLLVVEHDARTDFGDHPALLTARRYGETHVSLLRAASGEGQQAT